MPLVLQPMHPDAICHECGRAVTDKRQFTIVKGNRKLCQDCYLDHLERKGN